MKKIRLLAMLMVSVMLVASFGAVNVSYAERENNIITEFGNTTEIAGLTYCDTEGYNSTSSVRYTKTAEENTADTNLAMPAGLGLVEGEKYIYSFYFKPVTFTTKLWIRVNSVTNNGGGAIGMTEGVLTATNGPSCTKVEAAEDGWYKVYSPVVNDFSKGTWSAMPFISATSGAAVDFYIDNFSLKDEAGNEIIENGGFEYQESGEEEEIVRENNIITEFGNTTEIAGLTYCDTVGHNSTSSVRYTKTAEENTVNTGLAMPANLGMVEDQKYSFRFYIKPVAMTDFWIRINGATNSGAGRIKFDDNGVLYTDNAASFMTVTSVGNGWYKVASNAANTHAIAWSGMELLLATSGAEVDFYIDDFSIIDEAGNEMITNGGFEYQAPEEDDDTPDVTEPIITRTDNIVTEFGNTTEIDGLTYCDTVGYNSTSSVYYKKAAADNTENTNLAMPGNLGLVTGKKYKVSFYIKPVAMTTKLWTRMNGGGTNVGAAALSLNESGALTTNGASFLSITSAGNGWYKVSTSLNEHQIGWSGMYTIMAESGGDLEFYMDDFSILDESNNEIVTNGGFELPASQVGDFVLTDNGDGTKTVTATVANRAEGDDYTAVLILAAFDGVVMKKIAHADVETTVAEGKIETLSETIALSEGESLRAFVWNSVSGMTPLTFARELVSAQ